MILGVGGIGYSETSEEGLIFSPTQILILNNRLNKMAKWGFRNIEKQAAVLWDNYTKYCPQKGVEGSKKLKLTQQSKKKKNIPG